MKKEENEWLLSTGEGIYNMLLSYKSVQFIICPCSIGDTVNIGAFVSTYKKVHSCDKVVLVVKQQHEDIAKMFTGVDSVFTVDDLEMWALRIYICMNKKFKEKNILYGHFEPINIDLGLYKTSKELSFVNEYKNGVLGIPLNTKMDPIICPEVDGSQYENSVLLLPYAQTFGMIDASFWEKLASEFLNNGKRVFCNIGPNEKCIKNTMPCDVSISELCGYANSFERIIGLRSGVMDALVMTGCTMDVIFTNVLSDIFYTSRLDGVRLISDISELNPDAVVRNYGYVEGKEDILINELLMLN